MTSRSTTAWTAIAAGVVSGVLSVGRLLLGNSAALETIVWAEDGLFALCVRSHGVASCTVEPYAGYLLALPRIIAWPVSLFPFDLWPLVTNLAAAVLAAVMAVLVVVVLRSAGIGSVASGFSAVLPVLVPIAGFEAINVYSSGQWLLLYVAVLALSFPSKGRYRTSAYAVGALITGLTMPTGFVLFGLLGVQALRKGIPWRGALVTAGSLAIGLTAQMWSALMAEVPRAVDPSADSLLAWVQSLPGALMTLIPGQASLTASGTVSSTADGPWGWVGLAFVVVTMVLGGYLLTRRDATAVGLGLVVLAALALGALPAVAGYANNRYFVIPIVLWIAALVIAFDHWSGWRPNAMVALAAVALTALWIPSLAPSPLRSTAVPEWPAMLAQARALCVEYPDGTATLTFTPGWPFSDAVFPGPTSNVVPCSLLRTS